MKNQENCKLPEDSRNTWGFNNLGARVILWFYSLIFEMFLLPFQSDRPMVHLLYPDMQSLLWNLMMKFICLKYLTDESTALGLHTAQLNNEKKRKALNKTDVGTKIKCLFAELDLFPSENCLIYSSSISYLYSQLFFDLLTILSWSTYPVHPFLEEIGFWKHQCHFKHSTQYWMIHEKLFTICFWCIPFRNFWRFMWLNTYSMASLPNQINSRKLVQKSLRRECHIIFAKATFILGICT